MRSFTFSLPAAEAVLDSCKQTLVRAVLCVLLCLSKQEQGRFMYCPGCSRPPVCAYIAETTHTARIKRQTTWHPKSRKKLLPLDKSIQECYYV